MLSLSLEGQHGVDGRNTVSRDNWLTFWCTVKYSAFLRKATRYNPTRGGMIFSTLNPVSDELG